MKIYTEIFNDIFPYKTISTVYEVPIGMEVLQVTHTFSPQMFTDNAICHLQILQNENEAVIIATELHTNPGLSITNAAEILANTIISQFDLDPKHTRFIEHYGAASYDDGKARDTYDEIIFQWNGKRAFEPKWHPIELKEIKKMQSNVKKKKKDKNNLLNVN